jgi:DNA-binding MarR family transcriptional regulator
MPTPPAELWFDKPYNSKSPRLRKGEATVDSTITLDPVIHAPARLRIMATLNALDQGDSLTFPRLKEMLSMTDGNLSTHLRRLEEAFYITQEKRFTDQLRGRVPSTSVCLTSLGKAAFAEYLRNLRALLD